MMRGRDHIPEGYGPWRAPTAGPARSHNGGATRCYMAGFPRRGKGGFPGRCRRGLIGMLLTIVIAAVIIIIVFAVYNQVTATVNAAQTALFVRQLSTRITQTYRGDYTDLTDRAVIGAGFVPETWLRDAETIEGPEGNSVRILSNTSDYSSYFILLSPGVSLETCKAVLSALRTDRTFDSFAVKGGPYTDAAEAATPEAILSECQTMSGSAFWLEFR